MNSEETADPKGVISYHSNHKQNLGHFLKKKVFTFLSAFSLLPPCTLFHSTRVMMWSGAQLCWPGKFASSKRNTELRPLFGPGTSVEVETPVNGVFPSSKCHCATSSKQEDAEALFMPELCTLSFTSKPPTLRQSQEISRWTDTSLLFASEGSPLLRNFSDNQLYWLYRGLAQLSSIEGFQRALRFLWLHLTVFSPDFRMCRVIFPPQLCPFQNNITFFLTDNVCNNIQISQVYFYVVDFTDYSTSICLPSKERGSSPPFKFNRYYVLWVSNTVLATHIFAGSLNNHEAFHLGGRSSRNHFTELIKQPI